MNRVCLIGVVLASSLATTGCGVLAVPGAPTSSQTPAIMVPAAAAQRGEIRQALSFSGDVRAREQITGVQR